jgi:hypothetical protein
LKTKKPSRKPKNQSLGRLLAQDLKKIGFIVFFGFLKVFWFFDWKPKNLRENQKTNPLGGFWPKTSKRLVLLFFLVFSKVFWFSALGHWTSWRSLGRP